MCSLCDHLQPRWTVCAGCDIEFPYHAKDQLAELEAVRLDAGGRWPWYVEGHVPDWLLPSIVWEGAEPPSHCSTCNAYGWRTIEDWGE